MIYPGTQFGPYHVDRELGRGGMALVYHAVDERTGAEVALKVLQPNMAQNRSVVRRFKQECEHALRMRHPNIVRAYESDEIDGIPYISLHYAPKGTLATLLKERLGSISLEETTQLLRRVALALDYAHSRNVLHRDVKPSNILIGPSRQIWLTDFGLARRLDDEAAQMTLTSRALGTPAYMSPEQIANGAELDPRSDIYSLGVVAYSMLCGEMPFVADSQPALLKAITDNPPTPPLEHNPHLKPGICFVLEKVLSKNPAARYATASEFVDALEQSVGWVPSEHEWAQLRREQRASRDRTIVSETERLRDTTQIAGNKGEIFSQPLRKPLGWLIALACTVAVLLAFQLLSGRGVDELPTTPIAEGTDSATPTVIPSVTAVAEKVAASQTNENEEAKNSPIPAQTVPNTATQSPTPHASPTVMNRATSTPIPVQSELDGVQMQSENRATSTAVPDMPATQTPTPTATATKLKATNSPTALPPIDDAVQIAAIQVQLLLPKEAESVSGKYTFSWSVEGELPTGYAFEPIFWRVQEDPLREGRGWGGNTTASSLSIDLTKYLQPGIYFWGVRLVESNPFKAVKLLSGSRQIFVQMNEQPSNASEGSRRSATPTPRSQQERLFR